MAQTPAVEGAAVSQTRSINKKPRREISGALHMLCQHEGKTKTRCAKSRAKLCRIARRVSQIMRRVSILHGKTRRGALVFDLADVVKDGYVMPLAFECAKEGETQKDFRQRLIKHCQEEDVLDFLFDFMKNLCVKNT